MKNKVWRLHFNLFQATISACSMIVKNVRTEQSTATKKEKLQIEMTQSSSGKGIQM